MSKIMDPQSCFHRIIEAISDKDWENAFHAMDDLFNFFAKTKITTTHDAVHRQSPAVPPATYIAIGDGGQFCYSLLSQPDGTAVFIRSQFSKDTGMFEEDHKYILPGV